jgi:hypothetical protein
MKLTVCSRCEKKLKIGCDEHGHAACANCGQLLDGVTTHKQIEVDEAVLLAEKQKEQASVQRNQRALRNVSLGLLLGANTGAILSLTLQVPASQRMLFGIGAGAFVGLAYWLIADLFDPGIADTATGFKVGGIRLHTDFQLLLMPVVMVALLRALCGNLHAGLMLPLIGTLLGTLAVAGWLGGTWTAMLSILAAILCGFVAMVGVLLLGGEPNESHEDVA